MSKRPFWRSSRWWKSLWPRFTKWCATLSKRLPKPKKRLGVDEQSAALQTSSIEPGAEEQFLGLGLQYYVSARSAVRAGLLPVCGNLYHHAIEMFLKAGLSQKRSLDDLWKSFGHELDKLWLAYKAAFPGVSFDEFDGLIQAVHHFEDVRYPDELLRSGAEILIEWDKPGTRVNAASTRTVPRYQLVVTDIDRLVLRFFEATSKNPMFFTGTLRAKGREDILYENPVGAKLVRI